MARAATARPALQQLSRPSVHLAGPAVVLWRAEALLLGRRRQQRERGAAAQGGCQAAAACASTAQAARPAWPLRPSAWLQAHAATPLRETQRRDRSACSAAIWGTAVCLPASATRAALCSMQEGPIHDVQWNPKGDYFVVGEGRPCARPERRAAGLLPPQGGPLRFPRCALPAPPTVNRRQPSGPWPRAAPPPQSPASCPPRPPCSPTSVWPSLTSVRALRRAALCCAVLGHPSAQPWRRRGCHGLQALRPACPQAQHHLHIFCLG